MAYSKCNAHDFSWQAAIAKKKKDLQATIRAKIPSCNVDVPVSNIIVRMLAWPLFVL